MNGTSPLGAWLIASATAIVILGVSIAPFLAPMYIRVEQDRAGTSDLTAYAAPQLDAIASSLIGDLVLWQGDFDVAVDGTPVLSERERGHMRDVRGVFAGFFALVALAAIGLALAWRRARDTDARFALWRAVAAGARGLAIALAVAGAIAIVAFDAAFEVFHRLFFSAGSYTFDPRTDRLVQLFPERFWSDTSIAVGIVALVAALLTFWQARRLASPTPVSPMLAASKART